MGKQVVLVLKRANKTSKLESKRKAVLYVSHEGVYMTLLRS